MFSSYTIKTTQIYAKVIEKKLSQDMKILKEGWYPGAVISK
jgi:hypothetical protein